MCGGVSESLAQVLTGTLQRGLALEQVITGGGYVKPLGADELELSLCLLKRLVLLERLVDESLGALGPVGDQGFELAPVAVGLTLEGGELALGFELRCSLRRLGGLGCKARVGCFRLGAKALVLSLKRLKSGVGVLEACLERFDELGVVGCRVLALAELRLEPVALALQAFDTLVRVATFLLGLFELCHERVDALLEPAEAGVGVAPGRLALGRDALDHATDPLAELVEAKRRDSVT